MRRLLAAGALCAAAGTASAQSGTGTATTSTTRAGGPAMPGQVVGSGFGLAGSTPQPVGTGLPPVGDPLMRPYDPSRPLDVFKGTGLNAKQVVAPISAFPPALSPEKNIIDRLYDKLDAALNVNFFSRPPEPVARPMNVTPGIFRRNRERADERMWRRD